MMMKQQLKETSSKEELGEVEAIFRSQLGIEGNLWDSRGRFKSVKKKAFVWLNEYESKDVFSSTGEYLTFSEAKAMFPEEDVFILQHVKKMKIKYKGFRIGGD